MQTITFVFALLLGGQSAVLAEPAEPVRGSQLRQELLDTVRVIAEYELGPPVEFVVIALQAEGDLAFARLSPQRPGGAPIDLLTTPMSQRDVSIEAFDGARMEVFLERSNTTWRIVASAMGATDAWWFGYRCDVYGAFLQDMGC